MRWLIVAGLATLSSYALAADVDSPKEMLFKSMVNGRRVRVNALQVRPIELGRSENVWMQVLQGIDGRFRNTIVQPLSMQGLTTVDNGKDWVVYCPDQKTMTVMISPRVQMPDPMKRIDLADKNYKLTFGDRKEIAGRKTISVIAKPKFAGMNTWTYYIDEETSFPMRIEMDGFSLGKLQVLDTVSIDFPSRVSMKAFDLDPKIDVRVVTPMPPVPMDNLRGAKAMLGFTPVIPKDLPFGMEVERSDFVREENAKLFAMRLTDGLARVTVYQWSQSSDLNPFGRSNSDPEATVNGVRIRVVGDLSLEVRRRILERFQAKPVTSASVKELGRGGELLISLSTGFSGSGETDR